MPKRYMRSSNIRDPPAVTPTPSAHTNTGAKAVPTSVHVVVCCAEKIYILHRGGSIVNHPPSFVETSIAAVFDAESTRILIPPLVLVNLNNAPPPLAVTTTAVESASAAIAGAEFLDAAPLDAEEVQFTGQLTTILDQDSTGSRICRGIGSRIRRLRCSPTRFRRDNAYRA